MKPLSYQRVVVRLRSGISSDRLSISNRARPRFPNAGGENGHTPQSPADRRLLRRVQLRMPDAVGRSRRDAEPAGRDHRRLRSAHPDERRPAREHRGRRQEGGAGRASPPGQLSDAPWLRWSATAAFLTIAGYCVARLAAAHRAPGGYPGRHRAVDLAHVLTGVGMAAMASPVGGPLPPAGWQTVFLFLAVWFAGSWWAFRRVV